MAKKTRKKSKPGPKPSGLPPWPMRCIKVPDDQWTAIQVAAQSAGVSVSEFIRAAALEKAGA